ncbi:zf-HC2 domain-containing protein [Chloroflexota bacterium]
MSRTLDCESIREILLDYINNEISDDERMLVSDHLSRCAACAMEMEALAAAESKLRQAYQEVTAGVSPSQRVWEAIKRETVGKERTGVSVLDRIASKLKWVYAWRHPVWRTAVAGAAALLCALVLLLNTAPVPLWTAAEQRAIDIATSDPAIQAMLAGEGVVYEVIPVSREGDSVYYQIAIVTGLSDSDSNATKSSSEALGGGEFDVNEFSDSCATLSAASQFNLIVDVESQSVVDYEESGDECLSADEIQDAVDIAIDDLRIGAAAGVENVTLLNDYDAEQQSFTGEMVIWVRLSISGEVYFAQVDLEQGKVVKLIKGGTE